MAFEFGTATDYRDLLHKTLRFLQSLGTIGTPVYTGAGNGTLNDLETLPQAPTETWTLSCSNATKTGSSNYGTSIAGETPVLHWRFNETSGAVAEDATANNIDGTLAGHRFWRVYITANNGSTSFTSIAELEFRASAGGADLTGAGLPLYSSRDFTSGNGSDAAGYDNSNATRWRTATNSPAPSFLGYDFGIPVDIREVAITATATSGELTSAPKDFYVQYSNDGVNWTTSNTLSAQTGWTVSQQRLFNAYSGTVTVPITLGTAGLLSVDTDKAFTFAGGAGAGCVASAAVSGVQLTGDVSMEMLVKPSSIAGTQFLGGVAGGGSANANNFLISLWAVGGYLKIYHEYGAGNSQQVITSYKLAAGRAYHVVLSRNSATKRYELIVGGVVRHTFDYVFPPSDGTASYFSVGLDPDGLYPFVGVIDEVALYNTQLSAVTAAAHAKAAIGHETFSVTGSVSGAQPNAFVGVPYKNNFIEFLIEDGSTDFTVGNNWTFGITAGSLGAQAWEVNRREYDKVFLAGHGLSGTEDIYVIIKTFEDVSADYYNWEIRGADGYDATAAETGQPNVCSPRYMPLWNSAIPYLLRASGRRFDVYAKISTTYQGCYAGFALPNATPTQLPRPVIIGGSTRYATNRWSLATDDARMFFAPGQNGLVLRNADGAWKEAFNVRGGAPTYQSQSDFITHPYMTAYLAAPGGANIIREDLNSVYCVNAITILALGLLDSSYRGVLGVLDGCVYVSGFGNAAENIIDIDGVDYWVVQNIFRTGVADYMAVRLQ